MKSKPEIVTLDKEGWKNLVVDILYNVLSLTRASKILLDGNIKDNKDVLYEHPFVAAAVYMFAVEEFGKALLMENYKFLNDKIEIKYKNEFLNHGIKFQTALKNLPDECKLLHKGSFGKNFGKSFDIDQYASIENRLSILYSDFDENRSPNILPQIDAQTLEKCLKRFTEIVVNNLESFNLKMRSGKNG